MQKNMNQLTNWENNCKLFVKANIQYVTAVI
jgi:hypothetical protein